MDTNLLMFSSSISADMQESQSRLFQRHKSHERSHFSVAKEFTFIRKSTSSSLSLSLRKITSKHRKFLTDILSESFKCGRRNLLNKTLSKASSYIILLIILLLNSTSHLIQAQNETTNGVTATSPSPSISMTTLQLLTHSSETEISIDLNATSATAATTTKQQTSHLEQQVKNSDRSSVELTNISVQSHQVQQNSNPKFAPVLRPSIEEVASQLSRKHLNLEHENWRLKQSSNISASSQQNKPQGENAQRSAINSTMAANEAIEFNESIVEAEQDIRMPPSVSDTNISNDAPQATSNNNKLLVSQNLDAFYKKVSNEVNRDQYSSQYTSERDSYLVGQAIISIGNNNNKSSSRRKKGNMFQQNDSYEDNELHQCYQYLQRHNSLSGSTITTASSSSSSSSKISTGQQIPCLCEKRKHFADFDTQSSTLEESVWLSCDNVQLIGNYLNSNPTLNVADADNSNTTVDSNDNNNKWTRNSSGLIITRFSQRDAGLQSLNSQKFYYLQLTHLKSIDLSDNRIRQMKMDLFHGLEDKLEYLNLANNFLGDSRVVFDSTVQNSNSLKNDKLSFNSDELNNLKKLKWLSLRNNQISQLGSSIFKKQQILTSTTNQGKIDSINNIKAGTNSIQDNSITNELTYLDLSENLFKFIPSESIQFLNKLKTLNLSKNRIVQLDQFSKFPNSITYLDLSENLIKIVRHCNLIDLPNLVEINLSHNQLSHLDKTAFLSSNLLLLNNLIQPPSRSESSSSSPYQVSNILDTANLLDSHSNDDQSLQFVNNAYGKVEEEGVGVEVGETTASRRLIIRKRGHNLLDVNNSYNNDSQRSGDYKSSNGTRIEKRSVNENAASLPVENESESESSIDEKRAVKSSDESSGQSNADVYGDDDLEAEESIFSSITSRFANKARQTIGGDELNFNQQVLGQFPSTLKLNLSYNFFEQIPGDSLLKFSHLQQLDLSYNRIRRLDSNYLCSIYNLVENIRYLDLSGNLLSMTLSTTTVTNTTASGGDGNVRLLNRLFGCLQKLEKLLLSANRLASIDRLSKISSEKRRATTKNKLANSSMIQDSSSQTAQTKQVRNQESEIESNVDDDDNDDDENDNDNGTGNNNEDLLVAESDYSPFNPDRMPIQKDRLTIRFGENFASKNLNTLDLSDNQLKFMPIIEQASNQATLSLFNSNITSSSNSITTNDNVTIYQLNHKWAQTAIYLNVLNLNYNYLEKLSEQEFEQLYNLRQLYLDYNKISTLPVGLMQKFTGLERLSLNGNKIASLNPLNELFERSIKTLKVLNMANNRLVEWPQINKQLIKEVEPTSTYNQEFNKRTLDIDLRVPLDQSTSQSNQDNPQQQQLNFALEELNLEGNLLTSGNITSLFDQLVHMRSLKVLNLGYNLISKIKSEWFKFANKNLQKLLLTGNKINNIELGSFALNQVNELIQLNLDHNLLKELKRKTFDSLPNLRELNLAFNSIHTINSETFHQINSLQILKINNNKLTSWKCEYFSNLCNSITGNINADLATLLSSELRNNNGETQFTPSNFVSSLIELDLSHNSISQLRANSISVHTKLTKLNLEHNKLSFIPHDLFKATTSSLKTGRQIQLVSSLKYIKLAHNNIQTIDNINFRPLKNLISLDLSFNELQTLGIDVILLDTTKNIQQEQNNRKVIISNNITNLMIEDELLSISNSTSNKGRFIQQQQQLAHNWPALSKLRHLNLSHNQLTAVNQSMLSELSPLALLNLDLSSNLLESDSLPAGFFTKITGNSKTNLFPNSYQAQDNGRLTTSTTNYDLVFTLKLESLNLSHNRLSEYPTNLLENHYTSIESCDLSHNRIQSLTANSNLMIQTKKLNLKYNPLNRESNELILFEQRNVRYLNLAATRLYAIQQVTASPDSTYLHNMHPSQIKYRLANQTSQLDLIRSISRPIDAPYLRHLNLSSNQLVWLAANVFDKMHSLQTLDLSNNQLTRLHLLNNQLLHVSSTLEFLNIGTNLFTNVDMNDFNQLTNLQYLDLSNLLSMQKMNCKFLAKLTALKTLKMFNYPQLRQTLNNLMNTLNANNANNQLSERLERKIRNELVMSTIGKHCFEEELTTMSNSYSTNQEDESIYTAPIIRLKWFNIENLELELFNRFNDIVTKQQQAFGASYKIQDELKQLLGPKTKRISLNGLNITSLSDDSLLGITNDELHLKISYTSLTQLPLRQVLSSVTKRTKLVLDFRNNNIQSIDMKALQLLDELHINNQLVQNGDHSSLKLSSNPIRCDCQTRPLWLWLNKRLENIDLSSLGSEEQLGDGSSQNGSNNNSNNANYWFKFNTISQTSDLKCYFPLKLRGKLTQHVNYNDLICKGRSQSSSSSSSSANINRQSRKRNETTGRFGDSYYSSQGNGGSNDEIDEMDEDDYIELDSKLENVVKLTKFNRYRQTIFNNSFYFVNFVPNSIQNKADFPIHDPEYTSFEVNEDSSNRIGKRDQNSDATKMFTPQSGYNIAISDQSIIYQAQQPNINYNKHRPNTHQKHTPINTLNVHFNQLPINMKALSSKSGGSKHSLLTDSDVYILTIISIAMTVMSFIIISICMFKYKMDKSEREHIFATHNKFMSPSLFLDVNNGKLHKTSLQTRTQKKSRHSNSGESPSSSSNSSSKGCPNKMTPVDSKAIKRSTRVNHKLASRYNQNINLQQQIPATRLMHLPGTGTAASHQPVLVPINQNPSISLMTPGAQNFLMRSPTIRRMQGIATNASDWFKFTLRAYPRGSARGVNRKKGGRLFVDSNSIPTRSQLATAQFAESQMRTKVKQESNIVPEVLIQGCPTHKFDAIQRLKNNLSSRKGDDIDVISTTNNNHRLDEQCLHCNKLLASVQQTKVQYIVKATQDETTSSSDITSNHIEHHHHQQQAASIRSQKNSNSSSSSPSFCSRVNNEQLDESSPKQSSPDQQPYYISPKLIRALAKQLDQQQEGEEADEERRNEGENRFITLKSAQATNKLKQGGNKSHHFSSAYHTREQQAKSMKTFGIKTAKTDSKLSDQSIINTNDERHILPHSQIPATYVDGRFNYQTESQLDVVSADGRHHDLPGGVCSDSEATTTTTTRGEMTLVSPTSDQEEVFILIHDSTNVVKKKQACLDELMKTTAAAATRMAEHRIPTSLGQTESTGTIYLRPESRDKTCDSNTEINSIMNDECSHSSSPIAYGFMRSSPSVTTLSSHATMNHSHYNVHNSPDNMDTMVPSSGVQTTRSHPYEQTQENDITRNSSSSSPSTSSHHFNNNNIEGYSICRKEQNSTLVVDNNNTATTTTNTPFNQTFPPTLSDDQIIISRL